jgi:uncharacterized protein (TIRG00374 family)
LNEKTKSVVVTCIKFALSIAILAYLFNTASQDAQFDNFFSTPKKWGWIVAGFLACLAAHMIGFFRWQMMVRALGLPFSAIDAVRIGFIGLFFNLFAFGVIGGDTLRAFYVTQQMKDRIPEAISSVVADRVIGLLTMFTIASAAFLWFDVNNMQTENPNDLQLIKYVCQVVMVLTLVGYAGIAVLFCAPWLTKLGWYQKLMKLPKVGSIIERLTEVVSIYRSRPGAVIMAFLMSGGVNLCFAITIYSLAAGLTSNFPSFTDHFVIEPIAMVSNAVPLPGGIGGMELAMKFLYQAFSSPAGVIVAFAFRFSLLSVSAIGAIFWFTNKSKVENVMEAGAEDLKASE